MSHKNPHFGDSKEEAFIGTPIHQLVADQKRRHNFAWLGLFVLALGSFVTVGTGNTNFLASILPTQHSPAFDGTVYPVEKIPSWVKLSGTEYKNSYEQIPASKLVSFPAYNAANLATPIEGLKWGNAADDAIRDQKITYSVPYMGSYRMNGLENDGSHLAVDIKVPMNTPVRSIANGIVVKVQELTIGFGKHIVVRHDDVPSVENPSIRTTYYSSYSHLGSILVKEGDVVLRGQNIALSGISGDATGPHIHFQIDNALAPWHPYWPFTYQEQVAAKLDFVGALNAGLGRDNALLNTINPMTFVQNNLTSAPILAAGSIPAINTSVFSTPVVTPAVTPVAPVAQPTTPVVTPTAPAFSAALPQPTFRVNGKSSYQTSEDVMFSIDIRDHSGNPLSQFDGSALILLSGDVGILSNATITSSNVAGGQFVLHILTPKAGKGQITVLYNDVAVKSDEFQIVGPSLPVSSSSSVSVNPNRPRIFADVSGSSASYDAIKYVKDKEIFGGYTDGTFKPDQVISRVEVLKVALKTANRPLLQTTGMLSFIDIDANGWYIPYIATAQQNGITQGYNGGFFKPHQNVTRAEFLKILLLASPISIDPQVNAAPYSDVKATDWYAVFAQYAKQKNLLPDTTSGFQANEEITRGEVAEIVYRLLVVMKSGASTYTAGLGEG